MPTMASAHSEFVSSSPSNGEVLSESPKTIDVTFSDKISLSLDSFQLLNSKSAKIDTEKAKITNSKLTLSVEIPKLKDDNYIVIYTIVSADTHVIKGAFSFTIGDASKAQSQSENQNQIAELLAEKETPRSTRLASLVSHFLIFVSIALIIAAIAFKLLILEAKLNKKNNIFFYITTLLCIAATFISVGLQAATSGNYKLSKAFSPNVLNQEFHTQYGKIYFLRIIICLLAIFVWKFSQSIIVKAVLLLSAWGLALTPALTGHASSGEFKQLTFIFDVAHVIAASIWIGGLILIPFYYRDSKFKNIVSKFSKIAFYCVITILITGLYAFWRQSKTLEAARFTFFGQLVFYKIAIFISLIVIAYFSRSQVKKLLSKSDDQNKKKLIKLIYLESILLVVVMMLTSVLVNSVPAKTAIDAGTTKQIVSKKYIIEVDINTTKAGFNNVHVYLLNKNGTPKQAGEGINALQEELIVATWSNDDKKIEALPLKMRFLGLNHFVSTESNVPSPGVWTLSIRIKIDEFTNEFGTVKIKFR